MIYSTGAMFALLTDVKLRRNIKTLDAALSRLQLPYPNSVLPSGRSRDWIV